MSAAVGVEHLLAGPEHLHWPARVLAQLGDAELVAEGVRLAAEGAAEAGLDDADLLGLPLQHAGESAMDVVGDLGRAPEREDALGGHAGHGAVRFDGRVSRAVELVVAVHHEVRALPGALDVTELQLDVLGDVVVLAVGVDLGLVPLEGLARIHVGVELLVLDVDELEGRVGRVLVHRGHGRDLVADEADLVHGQRGLVRGPRNDAVLDRQVLPVITARTPGSASARLVSMETIRAWAWGLRSVFAWSIPGSWMSSA